MKVLVTGGAGYIGSTICSALDDAGHTPVVIDSLITGPPAFARGRAFYQADISDRAALERVFADHPDIARTVHCAALIVVPESVEHPYRYYRENVSKSLELFRALHELGRGDVVFSSSASIYGNTATLEVTEAAPLDPSSPYARTKAMMEQILEDFCRAYPMRGLSLRYFNPIGADPRLRSGPHVPNASHVLGKLVSVASGREAAFSITGTTWPTRDGTGLRDYVHVWDLARAHVRAVEAFDDALHGLPAPYRAINLGTGRGVTVRELVAAFQRVYGRPVPVREAPPRPGDVAGAHANPALAGRVLGWRAELSLERGIEDALRWEAVRAERLAAP